MAEVGPTVFLIIFMIRLFAYTYLNNLKNILLPISALLNHLLEVDAKLFNEIFLFCVIHRTVFLLTVLIYYFLLGFICSF